MTKVYILCKEDEEEAKYDDSLSPSQRQCIIKVFSNHTQALKSLYEHVGCFKEDKFQFNNSYFLLSKLVDEDQESEDVRENVYYFNNVINYITKDIWQKVIDELPDKNTLKTLISFEHGMQEYLEQEKKVAEKIVESKKYLQFNMRKELDKKLDELNIKKPKLFTR